MKSIIFSICSVIALSSFAQGKISLYGLAKLNEINTEIKAKGTNAGPSYIEAIVTMNDGWSESTLTNYGAELDTEISENVIIAKIPVSQVEIFAEDEDVYYVEFGKEYHATLDFARPSTNVTNIHNGFEYNSVTMSFTGKGVVTGLMDTGIDPNHINFTDASGNTRVKQVVVNGVKQSRVESYTTDTKNDYHGTHVAGIMAGSYNGEGKYAYITTATGRFAQTTNGNIPYYGVATGSDIAMSAGTLTESNILKGVKAIVDYAKETGQPAVVNLSLGSNNGPHDGSESLERNLASYGNDVIICISSGNEGDYNMAISKKFTDGDTELKTFVQDNMSSGIDIWTNGSDPVTVTAALYAVSTGKLTDVAKVSAASQSQVAGSAFTTAMNGSLVLSSEVNRINNRYHVSASGTFTKKNSAYNLAIIIEGKPGQEVYVYGYGDYNTSFTSNRISGYTDGTADGTINGMACADNVIAVGSYTTRSSVPSYAGAGSYGSGYAVNDVTPFSSYGTSYQGVVLPTITAPGCGIVSSMNHYYTDALSTANLNGSVAAEVKTTKATYYWGNAQGTSMSSPFVAGTIALWLEADPTLTFKEVDAILRKTAVQPSTTSTQKRKQWGGGKLDALAGIKEVLDRKNAGLQGVLVDVENELIVESLGGKSFNITVSSAADITATLYNMQGVAVTTVHAGDNSVVLDASNLRSGQYILSVSTPNTHPVSRKLIL